MTKTLILVSCLFVICTLPNIAVRVVPFFVGDFRLGGRYQNAYMSVIVLLFVTPTINSCLNFFFYLHMGSRFRMALRELCCCWCWGSKGGLCASDDGTVVTMASQKY